jgi:tripeptide aminopeptidase
MPLLRAPAPDNTITSLMASERVRRATEFFSANRVRITEEQVGICSIPAPPFGEQVRAEYFLERLRQIGLSESAIDEEGNCLGLRKGRKAHPLLVVSAHLDTVFPAGTDFTVSSRNGKLYGPGIADDGCGLVAILSIAEALNAGGIETEGSILFVATVGEEGEGNLRGVRHLFKESSWPEKIDAFVSFDGSDIERITNAAIGSRRYRATLKGSGGHSWGDFGTANPVHALGRAISRLAAYPAPTRPRTTFNVGRITGGTATNVISSTASMDVDLRSESAQELQRLDAFFRRALRESIEDENALRRGRPQDALELELKLIGDRPIGETSADERIVRMAEQATRAVGATPRLDRSSTDSNLPISLGIPALTLGAGGSSGNIHTLDEWYEPHDRHLALTRNLLLTLAMVGI